VLGHQIGCVRRNDFRLGGAIGSVAAWLGRFGSGAVEIRVREELGERLLASPADCVREVLSAAPGELPRGWHLVGG
jgi:hypothetical protein